MSKKERILFIEHEESDISEYKLILNSVELDNFYTDFASSAKEGLELYKKGLHKIVVIGETEEEFYPLDVAENLINNFEKPAIIVITRRGDEYLAVELIKLGVYEYLTKDQVGLYLKLLPNIIKKTLDQIYTKKQRDDALSALRESSKRFQRLEDNLPGIFIYSHNTDGIFTYLSPSIKNVLGYTQEEFLNHYSTYMTDNPINKSVYKYTSLSIMGFFQKPYEIEIMHKNGNIHRLNVSEIPVFDDNGKVIAVEGIAKDVTELHQNYSVSSNK